MPVKEIQFTEVITVELIRCLADDMFVAQAARVSTGRDLAPEGTVEPGQGKLINYLMKKKHGSPFEHGMFTFRVHAPLFVAREWQRHRTGWSYNELSGRYSELEPVFYLPPADRAITQQGRPGAYDYAPGSLTQMGQLRVNTREACRQAWECYQAMLDAGISRELARGVLPLNLFTAFYATCNPRSLMHWLSLRSKSDRAAYPSDPMAEIAEAARQVEEHFSLAMPVTWSAYDNHGRVSP
jgi:thymidylate synthase (FAD)